MCNIDFLERKNKGTEQKIQHFLYIMCIFGSKTKIPFFSKISANAPIHRQIRGNFSAHIEKSIISDSFYIEKSIILWYNYVEKSVTSKKDEEVCSSARRMTK